MKDDERPRLGGLSTRSRLQSYVTETCNETARNAKATRAHADTPTARVEKKKQTITKLVGVVTTTEAEIAPSDSQSDHNRSFVA